VEWLDILALSAFLTICLVVYLAGKAIARLNRNPIRERLAAATRDPDGSLAALTDENLALDHTVPEIRDADPKFEALDIEISQAGWYAPNARRKFLSFRNGIVLFVFLATGAAVLVTGAVDFEFGAKLAVVGSLVGFFVWAMPRVYLRSLGQQRVARIRRAMPDALDLMTMCLSGGLPLTHAFSYVSREIFTAHPDLAVEFLIVQRHSEMRSFEFAFREFARRIDTPEVTSLSALVTQGQRLGTDIATSIRDYADAVRLRRRQSADERASKAGVKMLFPLTLCLLPSVFMILWGPSALELWTFLQSFQGASAGS